MYLSHSSRAVCPGSRSVAAGVRRCRPLCRSPRCRPASADGIAADRPAAACRPGEPPTRNTKTFRIVRVQNSTADRTKNNKRISRTRRQRGYHWETTIVRRINSADSWHAFRLGSPSASLPDVLAVSTEKSAILAIEAKSGTTDALTVPAEQIERCVEWARIFGAYDTRKAVLAFKFLARRRVGLSEYRGRRLHEYFKVWDAGSEPVDCICTYDGVTYARGGERRRIELEDCHMPFG